MDKQANKKPTLPSSDQPSTPPEEAADKDPRDLREKLRDVEEQLTFVLESVKDYALLFLGLDGVTTGWSSGAEKVLGYSKEEILGQPVHRIFTPQDIAEKIPELE